MLRVNKGGAVVRTGASDKMPALGKAKANALIRSDGSFGGKWYRVQLGSELPGFVRAQDVKVLRGPMRKATANAVRTAHLQAAPVISMAVPSLVTKQATVRLRGTVTDERSLKDVFAFVNDKKVFFRSLEGIVATAAGVSAPFDFTFVLEPGSNTVMLVARENDDLMSRKVFGVFLDQPAVAGRSAAGKRKATR